MTRIFEGYNRLVLVAMTVLAGVALYRWWIGHPAVNVTRMELALLGSMALLACAIIFVLHPQAAALQAEAFGAKDEQTRKAAFEAFFRLHMPVRTAYMINLVLGIALLVVKAKRSVQREDVLP